MELLPDLDSDRSRLWDALAKLWKCIADPELSRGVESDLKANRNDMDKLGVMASVLLLIAVRHCFEGRPLMLPQVVIDECLLAGLKIKTPFSECESCGYSLPQTFSTCPLCGGRVGFALYALRRGRVALSN